MDTAPVLAWGGALKAIPSAYIREALRAYRSGEAGSVIHGFSREDPHGPDAHLDLPERGTAARSGEPFAYAIPGFRNVRDIGGWTGLRLGRIFRGSQVLGPMSPEAQETVRRCLAGTLGIRVELDLRPEGEGAKDAPDFPDFGIEKRRWPIGQYLAALENPEACRGALLEFVRSENYPLYVHCGGGADRTGTIVFLVEALCGVEEAVLDADYEFTSFATIFGLRDRTETTRLPYASLKAHLRDDFPASSLQASAERLLREGLGLLSVETDAIRRNLLP